MPSPVQTMKKETLEEGKKSLIFKNFVHQLFPFSSSTFGSIWWCDHTTYCRAHAGQPTRLGVTCQGPILVFIRHMSPYRTWLSGFYSVFSCCLAFSSLLLFSILVTVISADHQWQTAIRLPSGWDTARDYPQLKQGLANALHEL